MNDQATTATQPATWLPWLKLMRLPTVFTALANILCGYLVSAEERHLPAVAAQPEFWLLLLSSTGLYLGGMVLNDVFDAELDAKERPQRPIPSGQISRRSATVFGSLLMFVGLSAAGTASMLAGVSAIVIAAVLASTVVLYDGLLKNTALAPMGMAGCRFLNVMLGASCCGAWKDVWSSPQLMIAASLGVYVFGVTWFAQNEAGTSSRKALFAGLMIVVAGLGGYGLTAWGHIDQSSAASGALIAVALVGGNVVFRCLRAIRANQPVLLQKTVGFMLLNIIFVDAAMTFCFTGSGRLATLVVILVIPATLMKRVVPMS